MDRGRRGEGKGLRRRVRATFTCHNRFVTIEVPHDQLTFRINLPTKGKGYSANALWGDIAVSALFYDLDERQRILTTRQFSTPEDFRGNHLGKWLWRKLAADRVGYEIRSSFSKPDPGGARVMESLREEGEPYHRGDCFENGGGCKCNLGGRVRGVEPE